MNALHRTEPTRGVWGARLKHAASVSLLTATTLIILGMGTALGALYLLIRFIHWSWAH